MEFGDSILQAIREGAQRISADWPEQLPPFAIRTGWASSYDQLLRADFEATCSEEEIIEYALVNGRAILAGRGGDGKTWLLRRLYKRLLETPAVPIFIDLKQWTGADYQGWADWTADDIGGGTDFIVRRFAGLNLGAIELDRLPPITQKIILVDGLNEITSKVGAEILIVLDGIVANQINTSVLVADRLVRRDLEKGRRWRIGTPLPLTVEEVRRYLGNEAPLEADDVRTRPFFLDAEIKYGSGERRRAATLRRMLREHGGLADQDLQSVANAAFRAYSQARTRTFDRKSFESWIGPAAFKSLEEAGTVSCKGGSCFFTHHMLHDFLAAKHVSQVPPDGWNPALFRVLSFDASSFDAVEIAFELLPRDQADLFLQRLYDWNLYAAGYALAQARNADDAIGKEIRTVIFAMLADKRFDPIIATRQRACDALALMQLSDVGPFRVASSTKEVCEGLRGIESNTAWFTRWRDIFCLADIGEMPVDVLREIRDADSIIGWTVANVAKQARDNSWMADPLQQWLLAADVPTVRWRIAHVLGALPSKQSIAVLTDLLDKDPDEDVRYGSIRSLVELAARADAELRNQVSIAIQGRAHNIAGSDRVARELRSSLLLDAHFVPADWLNFVRDCVRAQFNQSDRVGERDVWRGCLNDAEYLYSQRPTAAGAPT